MKKLNHYSFCRILLALSLVGLAGSLGAQTSSEFLLHPSDLEYLGAFKLPTTVSGSTFGAGGFQLALNPQGDPGGGGDGFPGSLYISGHVRDQLVAEVSIPAPVVSTAHDDSVLPRAQVITPFRDPTGGLKDATGIASGDQRLGGMCFFDAGDGKGIQLYWTVWQWYNVSATDHPSHGISNPYNQASNSRGVWFLGDFHIQMTAGYIFSVPKDFADLHLGGKRLISGLEVATGTATTSNGPAMFAYAPWKEAGGNPPSGSHLGVTPLMYFPHATPAPGYEPCDEWRGGSWVTAGTKQAIIIVGRKSLGAVYYGIGRPGDCNAWKGYHCDPYDPMFLFFDPEMLAASSRGDVLPWKVSWYFSWSPKAFLWPTCEGHVDGVDYDPTRRLLYVLQSQAYDEAFFPYPLVHVFRVNGDPGPKDIVPPSAPNNLKVVK